MGGERQFSMKNSEAEPVKARRKIWRGKKKLIRKTMQERSRSAGDSEGGKSLS